MKMFAHERRQLILNILNSHKRITVKALSEQTNVSEATLRADLNSMEKEGLLIRTHGGATLVEKAADNDHSFTQREKKNREEKVRIGVQAAELVRDGQCILLDASTTALELAQVLKHRQIRLTVVTSGIRAALELKENPGINVILLGGMLRPASYSIEGTLGVSILEHIHVDTMFASANGFTVTAGLTDFNVYEVELKKAMVAKASRLVALLDNTKIGGSSIASFAATDNIDVLITDGGTSQALLDIIREQGIEVIVA